MRTTPAPVPLTCPDAAGVAVLTRARSAGDVTRGALWDAGGLAAAQICHVHVLSPTQVILVTRRRWFDPTLSSTDPGRFTDYTEDTVPGWVLMSIPDGISAVIGAGFALPCILPIGERVLIGATSLSNRYLYVLTCDGTIAVLTAIATPGPRAFTIFGEDILPSPGGIVFGAGVWIDGPYIVIAGTDASHHLYLIRKPWQAVGTTSVNTPPGRTDGRGMADPSWQYYGIGGWVTDPAELAPWTSVEGVLSTRGPVCYAECGGRQLLSTVALVSTTYSALVWSRTSATQPWVRRGTLVIGSSSDGSYLGGGLHFQPMLTPSTIALGGGNAALCAVYSRKTTVSEADKLSNTWGWWRVATTNALPTPGAATPAPLHGAGALSATAVVSHYTLFAAFPGSGALSASARAKFPAGASLPGHGALSAAYFVRWARSAALSGHGALTVIAHQFGSIALLSGHGTLSAAARLFKIASTATLSGHGLLSARALSILRIGLPGHGVLSAQAASYDGFNRANASTLGTAWASQAGQWSIVSDQAFAADSGPGSAVNVATWKQAMSTDGFGISAKVYPQASGTLGTTNGTVGLLFGVNSTGTSLWGVLATQNYLILIKATAWTGTPVDVADYHGTINAGDLVTITRASGSNVYTISQNGTVRISYTDSGSQHPIGSSYRLVGVYGSASLTTARGYLDDFKAWGL